MIFNIAEIEFVLSKYTECISLNDLEFRKFRKLSCFFSISEMFGCSKMSAKQHFFITEIDFDLDKTFLNDTGSSKIDPSFNNLDFSNILKFAMFLSIFDSKAVYNFSQKLPNESAFGTTPISIISEDKNYAYRK